MRQGVQSRSEPRFEVRKSIGLCRQPGATFGFSSTSTPPVAYSVEVASWVVELTYPFPVLPAVTESFGGSVAPAFSPELCDERGTEPGLGSTAERLESRYLFLAHLAGRLISWHTL